MELPKDVYEYLTNFADDRDILNMLSVNRQFNFDDEIFRRVMQRKYPLLIRYRNENETWKSLFIRMVYYLSELKEKYGIPYIPTDGCDPKKILKNNDRIYEEALFCAAAGGHLDLVKLFIEKGARNFSFASYMAGKYGKKNIIDYLFQKNKNLIVSMFNGAAAGGQIDLLKYLIEKGDVNNFTTATAYAAQNGQLNAVKFLVKLGADIGPALITAKKYKQKEVEEFLENEV